jgi:hypothetical protein
LAAYGAHDEGLLERALISYAVWIAASWLRAGDPAQVAGELRFLRAYRR